MDDFEWMGLYRAGPIRRRSTQRLRERPVRPDRRGCPGGRQSMRTWAFSEIQEKASCQRRILRYSLIERLKRSVHGLAPSGTARSAEMDFGRTRRQAVSGGVIPSGNRLF